MQGVDEVVAAYELGEVPGQSVQCAFGFWGIGGQQPLDCLVGNLGCNARGAADVDWRGVMPVR